MIPLYRFAVLGPIAALLMIVTALGQSLVPQPASTSTAIENAEREKTILYREFLENYKNDPPRAYKTACDYLQRFAADESGQTKYVKKFVRRFERSLQQMHVTRLLNEKNYAEAFRFGKEMLKSDPKDFLTLYTLVQGGAIAFANGNRLYRAEAAEYAKRALVLIENENSLVDKETNLSLLYVSLGVFYFTSDEEASRYYFTKFSALESARSDPRIYAQIADAIIGSEYTPLQCEFNSRFPTPQQRMSTQAQALLIQLYRISDFIIDALARAIALAGSDPKFAQLTGDWREKLITLYKFRNITYDTGLPELIQEVLHKPFPRPAQHYY